MLRKLLAIVLLSVNTRALDWGEFKDNGCIFMNLEKYSSILWNIPWGQSWYDTCMSTSANINGKNYLPNYCESSGVNIWGNFYVDNPNCTPGNMGWGVPQVGKCVGKGKRKYSAILWDIPIGWSWEISCERTKNVINNQTLTAINCINTGKMWGEFETSNDISCDPTYGITTRPETENYNPRLVEGPKGIPICERCDELLLYDVYGKKHWYGDGCSDPLNVLGIYHNLFYPACLAHDLCGNYGIEHNLFGTNNTYANKEIEVEVVTNICAEIFYDNMLKICSNQLGDPLCISRANDAVGSVKYGGIFKARNGYHERLGKSNEREAELFRAIFTRAVLFTSVGPGVILNTPDADQEIRIYSPDMNYFFSFVHPGVISVFDRLRNPKIPSEGMVVYSAPNMLVCIFTCSTRRTGRLTDQGTLVIADSSQTETINIANTPGTRSRMSMHIDGSIHIEDDPLPNPSLLVELRKERFEVGHIDFGSPVPYSWGRPGDVFTHVPSRFEQDMQISCGERSCDQREFTWTVPGSYKPKLLGSSACTEPAYNVKVTCAWGGEYRSVDIRNMLFDLIKSNIENSAKNFDEGRDSCISQRKSSPESVSETDCFIKAPCQSITSSCISSRGLCSVNGGTFTNTDEFCTGNYDCNGYDGKFLRLTLPKVVSVRWYHGDTTFSYLRSVCSSIRVENPSYVPPNIDCTAYDLDGFVPRAIALSRLTKAYGTLDIRCYG